MTAPAHLAPHACYICGHTEHAPTPEHEFWSNADAARHFAAATGGALPSMTAAETLDPREAITPREGRDFDAWLRRRNVVDLTPGELDEINEPADMGSNSGGPYPTSWGY